jgi:hypothetical protein
MKADHDDLLKQFVVHFCESGIGGGGEFIREDTPKSALDKLYAEIPAKFPPIYERLVLTYRWDRSELEIGNPPGRLTSFEIFGNPPGRDLDELRGELFRDQGLKTTCLASGFIQFASGPNFSYDAICFDTSQKNSKGDYALVQLDHESILCKDKIRLVRTIAPSFESLVHAVIATPLRTHTT